MGVEIERKFLVNRRQWEAAEKPEGKFYRQGYLHSDAQKTVRVRIAEDAAFLTIKGETMGLSRPEFEYPLPLADAHQLLDAFTSTQVIKTRYRIAFEGKTWEVDEFAGDNEGLILAEIELDSEDEVFMLPDWVDREVTGDPRYYNSFLANHPFTTW